MTELRYITAKRAIVKLMERKGKFTCESAWIGLEKRFNLGTIRRAIQELEEERTIQYTGKCDWIVVENSKVGEK